MAPTVFILYYSYRIFSYLIDSDSETKKLHHVFHFYNNRASCVAGQVGLHCKKESILTVLLTLF